MTVCFVFNHTDRICAGDGLNPPSLAGRAVLDLGPYTPSCNDHLQKKTIPNIERQILCSELVY